MNNAAETPNPAPLSRPDFYALVTVLGDPSRWRILKELSAGEPLLAGELAERIGRSPAATHKHIACLRDAGVVISRGQLHQISKTYLTKPGALELDLGHCLLRLDQVP